MPGYLAELLKSSHLTGKSSLFPPERANLGVYGLGERRAPA